MMTPYPVPVIASLSTDGKIQPLYVRIGDESLKIIQSIPKLNCMHPTFQCIVDDNGIEKHVTLTFYATTTRLWLVEWE